MKTTKQMRLQLAKLLKLYSEKPTDEGFTLVSEHDFELGSEVFVLTENGDIEVAPDGVYHADGVIYTVADGLIASIEEVEKAVVVEEPIEDPSLVDSEIDIIRRQLEEREKQIEERDRTINDLNDKLNKTVQSYEKTVKDLNDKLNTTVANYEKVIKEKDAQIAALETQIAELLGKSGKPVVEETIEETEKEEETFRKQRKNAGVEIIKKFKNQ